MYINQFAKPLYPISQINLKLFAILLCNLRLKVKFWLNQTTSVIIQASTFLQITGKEKVLSSLKYLNNNNNRNYIMEIDGI